MPIMTLDSDVMEIKQSDSQEEIEKLAAENGKLKTEIASLESDLQTAQDQLIEQSKQTNSQTAWLEKEIEKLNSKKEGMLQAYENVSKVEKQLIMDITRVEVQIETCQGELSRLATAEAV